MKKILLLLLISLNCFAKGEPVVLTIPKSGTNLVLKCINLINQRTSDTEWHHEWSCGKTDPITLVPTTKKVNHLLQTQKKVILILRDPRDLICAITRAIDNPCTPPIIDHIIFNTGEYLSQVTGHFPYFKKYNSFLSLYLDYLEWTRYSFVYMTHFDKLVGSNGGGTEEEQIQEILNIAAHIENPLSYEEAQIVANQLFGDTPTFHQGQIQDWKEKFSESNTIHFEEVNPGLLDVMDIHLLVDSSSG